MSGHLPGNKIKNSLFSKRSGMRGLRVRPVNSVKKNIDWKQKPKRMGANRMTDHSVGERGSWDCVDPNRNRVWDAILCL